MITAEKLTIGWGEVPLLQDMDFTIDRGDIFIILGGSGCGKSTLLRHLIGLEEPMGGKITIEGIGTPRFEIRSPPYGVMFQSGALFGSLTLSENVGLPLQKWTGLDEEAIDTVVRSKLKLVGLDGFEHHLPAEISGGMKKRAAIARAMALDPDLLFLDEPSAGLDPITAVELDATILSLNQHLGVTMVIVTHELASIFKIAKTCIMLDKETKGIIAHGNPEDLKHDEHPFVRAFFNRETLSQEQGASP